MIDLFKQFLDPILPEVPCLASVSPQWGLFLEAEDHRVQPLPRRKPLALSTDYVNSIASF